MDEGFEVLTLMQTGKARIIPVVLVDKPGGRYWETWFSFLGEYLLKLGLVSEEDFNLFHMTHSVEEAVEEIVDFYKNYRSYRWVGERMVMRLTHRLTPAARGEAERRLRRILKTPARSSRPRALPEEANEPELANYPRLVLTPHQRNFGGLRDLIDAINASEVEA